MKATIWSKYHCPYCDQAYNYINYWIPSNCLDYGCGKGVILSHLNEKFPNTEFIGYDPALPMWDNKPTNKFDAS